MAGKTGSMTEKKLKKSFEKQVVTCANIAQA